MPDLSNLRELRNAFGTFMTGVTVVTTREQGGIPRGFTANSFTSVSLDPAMLSICIGKSADSIDDPELKQALTRLAKNVSS